jgi:hypothetical protein
MEPKSGMCFILDTKKIIDDHALVNKKNENGPSIWVSFTKIPCTIIKDDNDVYVSKPINKSEINFDIYDIATFNKDIVIKDYNDKQYTGIEIEQNLLNLFFLDKNNQDYINESKQYEIENPPLDKVAELFKKKFDYDQQFLTKEEYNNCIISNWTPCKDSTQTRKRTESTKIGKACTTDENNLPLTQTCNNCIISDWTPCDSTNSTQTRTRTQALNSTACTPDENNLPLTQTCSLSPSPSSTPTPTPTPSTSEPSSTPESSNNMYIGIGIFVFFIFAIAFGFYISKQKNQNQN